MLITLLEMCVCVCARARARVITVAITICFLHSTNCSLDGGRSMCLN